MPGTRRDQVERRGPRLLISMTERGLRKNHALAGDDHIVEWKQGKVERWWVEGSVQPIPEGIAKLDMPQLRGLASFSYSPRRLFIGSRGVLAVDLEFVWRAESSSNVLLLVFSSPRLTAIRWRSDEPADAKDLSGFVCRIQAQRELRLAEVPAESRQRAAGRLGELERSGAMASAVAAARQGAGNG